MFLKNILDYLTINDFINACLLRAPPCVQIPRASDFACELCFAPVEMISNIFLFLFR